MSINKKIICSFLVVTGAMIYAMEEKLEKSQELKKSQSLEIINKSCSEDSPPYTFSFSLPTLTAIGSSVVATVNNFMYDTEAFKKLGWPITDKIAQQELEKTQEVYKRVNDCLQKRIMYSDFTKDYDFINRRQQYCQRVLQALPNYPQGVELALFCLKHHKPVMNFFDLTRFVAFVNIEQEKAQKAGAEFSQLTILPEETNQLLDKLFEQTLVVKNYPKESEAIKDKTEGTFIDVKEDSKQEVPKQRKSNKK